MLLMLIRVTILGRYQLNLKGNIQSKSTTHFIYLLNCYVLTSRAVFLIIIYKRLHISLFTEKLVFRLAILNFD